MGDGALICVDKYGHAYYNCLNFLVLEIAHYCYSNRHDRCTFHLRIFKYLSHHKTLKRMISVIDKLNYHNGETGRVLSFASPSA